MICSLAMYDRPETAAANDMLWVSIRNRLGYGPTALTRGADLWEVWQSSALLMAQTCGMPLRSRLHPHVSLIGTPDYGLPGCPAGYYTSVLVAHRDNEGLQPSDFSNKIFAYNEGLSQSGWAAAQNFAAENGFCFTQCTQTGSHTASARAVAERRADIAALDSITWALIQRYDSFAHDLCVLATTPPTPNLPLITAKGRATLPLFAAISDGISDLPQTTRDILHLTGLVKVDLASYLEVPIPAPPPV